MDFEGRKELALYSGLFFDENKNWFLDFAINLVEADDGIDKDTLKQALDSIYDSFLLKEPDFSEITKTLIESKGKENTLKYILARSFLELLSKYIKQNESKNHVYFVNAIQRMLNNSINKKSHAYESFSSYEEKNQEESVDFANTIFNIGEDKDTQLEAIIQSLKNVYETKKMITFLNLYKDVPIKSEANILQVNEEEAIFDVNPLQILAILEEKAAFILKGENFSSHLKADLISYSFKRGRVKLGNFSRLNKMPASLRVHTRVHPDVTTSVMLFNEEGQSIKGILYDISNGGIGVLAGNNLNCKNGDKIRAEFSITLPDSGEKIDIVEELTIVVLLGNDGTYRFCMKNINEAKEEVKIYTKKREEQTIQDLKSRIKNYR